MPHSNPPPSLPEVYDEAGKSPRWLPLLGVGLLVLLAALVASRFITPPTAAPKAKPNADVQVSAAATPARA